MNINPILSQNAAVIARIGIDYFCPKYKRSRYVQIRQPSRRQPLSCHVLSQSWGIIIETRVRCYCFFSMWKLQRSKNIINEEEKHQTNKDRIRWPRIIKGHLLMIWNALNPRYQKKAKRHQMRLSHNPPKELHFMIFGWRRQNPSRIWDFMEHYQKILNNFLGMK